MPDELSIAIVGAGIGGLCAALCLLQAGFDVHVYEQSTSFGEVGGGLQISPNASRILHRLGLAAALSPSVVRARELHQRRWSSRGVNSAFLNDAAIRFHQQLLDSSAGDGEPHMDSFHVDLLRIRAGKQTLGVLYMLLYAGRANLYQCGLSYDDNDSDNKLAPGLLSHALAIEHYLQRGFAEYDFLAGEEKSIRYKTTLGAQSRSLVWKDCYVPGPSTVLVRTLRTVWRRSRQLVGATT